MSNPETIIQNQIRLEIGKAFRHVRLFRNERGLFWAGKLVSERAGVVTLAHARRVETGLVDGAGDLIGWVSVVVTPDMVGKRVALFAGPEVKTGPRSPVADNQKTWAANVTQAGGVAGIVWSPAMLADLINAAPGQPAS